MATYKVTYFAMPGRGEVLRLTLEVGGVKWEDNRVAMEDWGKMKAGLANDPVFKFPWLPHLEVLTEVQMPSCDSILVIYDDFLKLYVPITFSSKPDEDAEKFLKGLETQGAYLERLLSDSKSGFLVGSKLTAADIAIFVALREASNNLTQKSKLKVDLSKFPKLKAHHEKIAAVPKIKAYYSK
ncbi:hypothetical protein BSL78_06916 [Apostichopus japonicus]|uniref:Uncharacterized protein n=1 Tax=Stichopus japonicus TaxID=307972 RepID=A0A2G8L7E7_STIJA|nr:hypothetical protein BSL78_06916 [Apostichopus japonicus]